MISPDICISLGRRAPPGEFSTPKAPSQCDGGPSLYHFSFLIVSSEYHCEPRSIVMAVQSLFVLWYCQYFIMVPSKFNRTPVRLYLCTVTSGNIFDALVNLILHKWYFWPKLLLRNQRLEQIVLSCFQKNCIWSKNTYLPNVYLCLLVLSLALLGYLQFM